VKKDVWASRDDVDTEVHAPRYRKPGGDLPGIDYDRKTKQLYVWRDDRRSALYEPDFQGIHWTTNLFTVRPDGEAKKEQGPANVTLARPFHPLELNEISAVVLPAGRGYAGLIDQVISCKEVNKGIFNLQGEGRWVSGLACRWELTVEAAACYIVREARCLTLDNKVLDIISNKGIAWFSRGPLPKTGQFLSSPTLSLDPTWQITYMDLSDKADEELIRHNRALLRGEFTTGTEVFDDRSGATVRTRVGEISRTIIPAEETELDDPILATESTSTWTVIAWLVLGISLFVMLLAGSALWRGLHRAAKSL
jgi:hypothetical protein